MTSWLGKCRELKGLRTQYASSCGYEFLMADKCEEDKCLRTQYAGSCGYEFLVTQNVYVYYKLRTLDVITIYILIWSYDSNLNQ